MHKKVYMASNSLVTVHHHLFVIKKFAKFQLLDVPAAKRMA